MLLSSLQHNAAIALHIALREARLQAAYRNKFLADVFSHYIGLAPILLITLAMSGAELNSASLTHLVRENLLFVVLGYIAFIALGFGTPIMQYTGMAWGISEEVHSGTIERNFLAPVSRPLVLFGIGIYYLALYLFHVITLVVPALLLAGTSMVISAASLFTAAAAILGLLFLSVGLGFAAAGFFLQARDQSLFLTVVHRPFMLLSGSVFLIDILPVPLKFIARINPVTYGIDAFRGALSGHKTLLSLPWELAVLYLGGMLTLCAGILLFQWSINRQLATGDLARY